MPAPFPPVHPIAANACSPTLAAAQFPLHAAGLVVLLVAFACSNPVAPPPPTGFGLGATKDVPDVKKTPDTELADAPTTVEADVVEAPDLEEDAAVAEVTPDVPPPADAYNGPACSTDKACDGLKATPICAKFKKQCVECILPIHCPDTNNCDATTNKCVDVSCKPGAAACEGEFLKVCNPDGQSHSLQSCPESKPKCVDNACKVCQPGSSYCAKAVTGQTDSKKLMKCEPDGNLAKVVQTCAGGTSCINGKCQSCQPGTKSCDGDKGMVCAQDGTGVEVAQDCGATGHTCQGGLCVDPCAFDPKSKTNVGCDYWAVDLDNAKVPKGMIDGQEVFFDAQNSQFSVILSNTSTKPAIGTVTAGTGNTIQKSVAAGGILLLNLPDPSWKDAALKPLKPLNQDGTSINKNVYRIQSQQPIVAYQFNPLQNLDVFSNDASLLLPSNGLGNEYWVMTREQSHATLKSYFTVVATQPGSTHVTVVSSCKTLPGPNIAAMKAGEKREFDLAQGQVLNVESDAIAADPTGTYIKSDKAIAVFGGSESSNSPNTDHCVNGKCQYQGWTCTNNDDCPKTCCADHLEEQLFPISSWGLHYVATKLQPRGKEKDAWRILAAKDDTVVTTDPPQTGVPKLQQGQWFEFESAEDFTITANQPIQVGQFMASAHAPDPNSDTCNGSYLGQKVCKYFWSQYGEPKGCTANADCPNIVEATDAKIGDPDFSLSVASDAFLKHYVFLVPDKYKDNYINVIAPVGTPATLDDKPIAAASFKAFGQGWSVARVPVAAGSHTLKSDKQIGLIVYGYADYVSYSYPGGAALK